MIDRKIEGKKQGIERQRDGENEINEHREGMKMCEKM